MKKALGFFILSLFFVITISAQTGKIVGKVNDFITGEDLIGVGVVIKETQQGVATDLDGKFSLSVKPGVYTLIFKYVSYQTKEVTGITVAAGKEVSVNVTLEEAVKEIEEVVITAEFKKESVNALLMQQKNSVSISDGISAESIQKTPDRNTSDVLKRVSGASLQDDKFAIIRGLNERYNAAYLNGAPLPSSESDRKAFSFDIFPSALLDNLVILKTASADLPADFAGGIIQVNTKSIPSTNFQTISVTGGYNTITTFKNQQTYQGGKLDWLGIDDGTRALSKNIPSDQFYPSSLKEQATMGKYINNNWGTISKTFMPNVGLQYSMGHNFKIKGHDFGTVLALTYNRQYTRNSTIRRQYDSPADPSIPVTITEDYKDDNYLTQTLGGFLANFSYKINNNHQIGFKNLLSITTDDQTILRTGTSTPLAPNPSILYNTAYWFTSNRIYSGQLNGSHFLPESKIKINWITSLGAVKRDVPDLKRNSYVRNQDIVNGPEDTIKKANVAQANVGPDYAGNIFYGTTTEKIYSFIGDASKSFENKRLHFRTEVKVGGLYQRRDRTFDARQLGFIKYATPGGASFPDSLLSLPPNQIFSPANMGEISPGVGGFALSNKYKATDSYTALSRLAAAFVMFDMHLRTRLRLIWGVRMEHYEQRLYNKAPLTVSTNKTDFLPSANLVYSLTDKQNLRFCFSETVNRPEFRELAPFAFYNFSTRFVVSGNSNLQRALIKNYDVRYEFYPGQGQMFSVSAFYKDFTNPIEQIARPDVTGELSYRNVPKAKNAGVEFEFRSLISSFVKTRNQFLQRLTVFSNIALIKSTVDVSGVIGAASNSRPLQGQSPYIINGGIQYLNSDNGTSFSVNYNRVGQRIAIVGSLNEPDIWENGRDRIDLQIGKTFFNNKLDVRIMAKDLLAQKLYFFQDRNGNKRFDRTQDTQIWVTNYGRTYSFNITYKLQ